MSQIKVGIEAPEGLPLMRPTIFCSPATDAEFDAVVEACGGPCAWEHHSGDSAWADVEGGRICLQAPEGPPSYYPPLRPSIQRLKDACQR